MKVSRLKALVTGSSINYYVNYKIFALRPTKTARPVSREARSREQSLISERDGGVWRRNAARGKNIGNSPGKIVISRPLVIAIARDRESFLFSRDAVFHLVTGIFGGIFRPWKRQTFIFTLLSIAPSLAILLRTFEQI